jgi:hypothetical protein
VAPDIAHRILAMQRHHEATITLPFGALDANQRIGLGHRAIQRCCESASDVCEVSPGGLQRSASRSCPTDALRTKAGLAMCGAKQAGRQITATDTLVDFGEPARAAGTADEGRWLQCTQNVESALIDAALRSRMRKAPNLLGFSMQQIDGSVGSRQSVFPPVAPPRKYQDPILDHLVLLSLQSEQSIEQKLVPTNGYWGDDQDI